MQTDPTERWLPSPKPLGLLNAAATALGQAAIGRGIADGLRNTLVLALPVPGNVALLLPYALLWLLLIYFAVRLMIRLAYSIFRLLVALLFGPLALILWAIPQTEWVTWLRQLFAACPSREEGRGPRTLLSVAIQSRGMHSPVLISPLAYWPVLFGSG